MGIEDEIRELVCRIKFKHLDGKLSQDIRTLIEKARSAPSRQQGRWYLAWAEQLAEKAREKVDKISCFNQVKGCI
ncbi:MAG: hypothetical protein FD143_3672 [Ignavibacteria bacterium]|nr:MAG: hypothetical protein FD143_3672 [Ignavibacteria bacterium]